MQDCSNFITTALEYCSLALSPRRVVIVMPFGEVAIKTHPAQIWPPFTALTTDIQCNIGYITVFVNIKSQTGNENEEYKTYTLKAETFQSVKQRSSQAAHIWLYGRQRLADRSVRYTP